ncbi:uncharacterized protein LOC131947985 [Physella acuta]|uniref:uncharacterized protein LOC131947985 n=1 Tax=Physella acuta TaxID=109671 RepID=UPI0027DD8A5F|nr:uncharacterized protein LOC131947985 [Physella acuta]XP_059165417.1 uncharacterized protein LOC131947985 [Physella acuta]XP_059165426.1 uncharacterized protein LOC131947985 [Physella acuta]
MASQNVISKCSVNNDVMALTSRLDSVTTEYQICRRKLESKCEALLILSRELDQCRSERDQFKLMAEQLRDRYQMVKRQLTGDTPMSANIELDPKTYSDIQTQSLARLLFDTKEANKSFKFEVDDLKQKLLDAEGDIKLLREQIARSRVGTTDEGLNTRHFPAHEREDLVSQLEASREEYVQLERDLQQVLDEKEELVTERDAYRTKFERMNTELNYILGGDEKRIVDIDGLIMENKYLQERLKQMEEEKTMAIATVTKYKSILEKKKTKGVLKLGQNRNDGLVITQKQVQQIMQCRSSITPSAQAMADLQGLCGALLDTINDKNLALSHQRKTNKLLGNRVNELEKKLKTLEVSGLWSVSGHFPNLEKLRAECEEIKTLVPRQFSQSTDASEPQQEISDFSETSSAITSTTSSPVHQKLNQLSRNDLEELDLLPSKEVSVKCDQSATNVGAAGNTDSGLGLSDVNSDAAGAARVALAEAMLRSLLGCHDSPEPGCHGEDSPEPGCHGEDSPDRNQSPSSVTHLYIDGEEREAAIQRCLRRDTDEEDEDFNDYDFNGIEDDEDEEETTSLEFKNLLEDVTTKLLQRSQALQGNPGQAEDQQVVRRRDLNVYITDDFDVAPVHNTPGAGEPVDQSDTEQVVSDFHRDLNVYITDDFGSVSSSVDTTPETGEILPAQTVIEQVTNVVGSDLITDDLRQMDDTSEVDLGFLDHPSLQPSDPSDTVQPDDNCAQPLCELTVSEPAGFQQVVEATGFQQVVEATGFLQVVEAAGFQQVPEHADLAVSEVPKDSGSESDSLHTQDILTNMEPFHADVEDVLLGSSVPDSDEPCFVSPHASGAADQETHVRESSVVSDRETSAVSDREDISRSVWVDRSQDSCPAVWLNHHDTSPGGWDGDTNQS